VTILWLYLLARGFLALWRRRATMEPLERSVWLAFGLWVLIHNVAFAVFLPAPGTASRYIAVDYIFMAAGVALGLAPAAEASRRSRAWLQAAAAGVAAVTVGTLVYWRTVYVSSVQQVAEVRITMAQHIDEIASPQAVVAAFDIGVLGYYLKQPMVDLGGLTDNRVLDYVAAGDVGQYLCNVQAAYLVAPESNSASGGSFYDYLDSLGLRSNPEVKLTEVTRTAMDENAWRVGGTTTGNSTAAVLLYRVNQDCE
jgi:hypothetical protein